MRRSRMVTMAACFTVATGFTLAACGGGGGGSNDNGVAVRFSGVFQETQEQVAPAADRLPTDEEHVGDTGTFVTLGVDQTVPSDRNNDGDLDGGFLGVENNLDQGINIESVHVEIFIPGAKLANPVVTDIVPLAISLPAATVDDQGVRTPSLTFAQTVFVRPDVMSFLAANQNLLPQLPFDMTVRMTIRATSDSGDTFETNEISYAVAVLAPAL